MSMIVDEYPSTTQQTGVPNFSRPNTPGSMGSVGSLTRRARTERSRRRDGTTTEQNSDRSKEEEDESDKFPGRRGFSKDFLPLNTEITLPPRPPRSPRRSFTLPQEGAGLTLPAKILHQRKRTMSSGAGPSQPIVIETFRGRQGHSEGGGSISRQRARARSVPRQVFHAPSSSDSSSQPSPLTPAPDLSSSILAHSSPRSNRQLIRDSIMTQQSGTSSSLYPPSISTVSGTDSFPSLPSPPSLPSDERYDRVSSVDPDDNPHIQELHELDADDVSYRLRLLVKNTYYLPPAHSKPYPSELPSLQSTVKKSSLKAPTPNLFDLFKVGKSRTKTPLLDTPEPSQRPPGFLPVLRTTSDSATVSAYVHPQASRSQTASPLSPAQPRPHQDRKGRVVVVRERMDDLAVAAKQAEHDLRMRGEDRRKVCTGPSDSHKVDDFDDFIDPTDAVDLPPPATGYQIAPQASSLNGLGVEASVGAAVLAERLPPSSPGMWSVDSDEAAWRKALLHEAVGHSLNNSPVTTPAGSTPRASVHFSGNQTMSPMNAGRRKRELGQRILSRIIDDDVEFSPQSPPHSRTLPPMKLNTRGDYFDNGRISSASYHAPLRAETPAVPTYPLAPPPPRTTPLTPIHSIFNSDEPGPQYMGANQPRVIRKTMSSPLLPNRYESHVGVVRVGGTPPPHASRRFSPSLVVRDPDGMESSPSHGTRGSVSSASHYPDDHEDETAFHTPAENTSDDAPPRPSLTVSMHSHGRPSSDYTQPSPTVSAFRDAMEGSMYHPRSSSSHGNPYDYSYRVSRMSSAFGDPDMRSTVLTPPPRSSYSHVNTVLPPPPRVRPIFAQPVVRSPSPSRPSEDSARSQIRIVTDDDPSGEQSELPQPVVSLDHNLVDQRRLSLAVPGSSTDNRSQPASPIAFFDEVEMQHMEELSSSEDEAQLGTEDSGEVDGEGDGLRYTTCDEHGGDHLSDGETSAILFVDPGTMAVSNVATGPQSTMSVLRLDNNSNPYLVPSSSEPIPPPMAFENLDRRKPIFNMPLASPSRSTFLDMRPVRDRASSAPRAPPAFEKPKLQRPATSTSRLNLDRPSTAGGNTHMRSWVEQQQSSQGDSVRKLDGMLIQHMENEKDTIRRITNTLAKS